MNILDKAQESLNLKGLKEIREKLEIKEEIAELFEIAATFFFIAHHEKVTTPMTATKIITTAFADYSKNKKLAKDVGRILLEDIENNKDTFDQHMEYFTEQKIAIKYLLFLRRLTSSLSVLEGSGLIEKEEGMQVIELYALVTN